MRNYYVDGDWNAICDRCGLKHKASQLRREWTGLMVCSPCWEPRHPQTLIRVPEEHVNTPWSREEPAAIYTITDYITTESSDNVDTITTEDSYPLYTET